MRSASARPGDTDRLPVHAAILTLFWFRYRTALPDWESIALNGRHVYVAFDSDVMTKPEVPGSVAGAAHKLEIGETTARQPLSGL